MILIEYRSEFSIPLLFNYIIYYTYKWTGRIDKNMVEYLQPIEILLSIYHHIHAKTAVNY